MKVVTDYYLGDLPTFHLVIFYLILFSEENFSERHVLGLESLSKSN